MANCDSSGICLSISSVTRWTPRCWGLRLIFFWNHAELDWMILPEEAMFDLLSLLSVASLNGNDFSVGGNGQTHNNHTDRTKTLFDKNGAAIEPIRSCLLLFIIIMSGAWGVFFGLEDDTGKSSASVGDRRTTQTSFCRMSNDSYSGLVYRLSNSSNSVDKFGGNLKLWEILIRPLRFYLWNK